MKMKLFLKINNKTQTAKHKKMQNKNTTNHEMETTTKQNTQQMRQK